MTDAFSPDSPPRATRPAEPETARIAGPPEPPVPSPPAVADSYRVLFEAAADALLLIDNATGEILEVNEAATTLYGYSRDALLQLKNTDLSAEPDQTRQATAEAWPRVPLRYHRTQDGTVFPVEITARQLLWTGRPAHLAAIRDLTARVQMEAALRESEGRLRTIWDTVALGIVIIDPLTHTIVDANPAAATLIGAPRDQLVGKVCFKNICPANVGRCPITDQQQAVDDSERTLLCADGSHRQIVKSVVPVLLDGRMHLLESFVDITGRKESEEALRTRTAQMEALRTVAAELTRELDLGRLLTPHHGAGDRPVRDGVRLALPVGRGRGRARAARLAGAR